MVTLNDVKVVIVGVGDHLSRSVRKRHRVLLKLRPEVWNLEDTKEEVSIRSEKDRDDMRKRGSVGTIGHN